MPQVVKVEGGLEYGNLATMSRLVRYVWASPNTVLGLLLAMLTGSRIRWRRGVWEAHGRGIRRMLDSLTPDGTRALALALGHVVLARDRRSLVRTRRHEAVHVAQYERWGPALLPAYLFRGIAAALGGADGYRDNPFERSARVEGPLPPVVTFRAPQRPA